MRDFSWIFTFLWGTLKITMTISEASARNRESLPSNSSMGWWYWRSRRADIPMSGCRAQCSVSYRRQSKARVRRWPWQNPLCFGSTVLDDSHELHIPPCRWRRSWWCWGIGRPSPSWAIRPMSRWSKRATRCCGCSSGECGWWRGACCSPPCKSRNTWRKGWARWYRAYLPCLVWLPSRWWGQSLYPPASCCNK